MKPGSSKTICPGCGGPIEVPGPATPAVRLCRSCLSKLASRSAAPLRSSNGRVWAAVSSFILLALAILAYRFRGHIFSAFGYLSEAIGGKGLAVVALVLAVLLLICVLSWLVFPIVVFLGLRDIKRRTAQVDETLFLCAQMLSQRGSGPVLAEEEVVTGKETRPGDKTSP